MRNKSALRWLSALSIVAIWDIQSSAVTYNKNVWRLSSSTGNFRAEKSGSPPDLDVDHHKELCCGNPRWQIAFTNSQKQTCPWSTFTQYFSDCPLSQKYYSGEFPARCLHPLLILFSFVTTSPPVSFVSFCHIHCCRHRYYFYFPGYTRKIILLTGVAVLVNDQ